MPRKQHIVRLVPDDRHALQRLVRTGRRSAWTIQRARIILLADTASEGPCRSDAEVATVLGVSSRTVARTRAAWCTQGHACLERKPRPTPPTPPKLSTAQVLELAALACTDPPPGHARWSLRLLAGRVVELGMVASIAPETVRQALHKGGSSRGAANAS